MMYDRISLSVICTAMVLLGGVAGCRTNPGMNKFTAAFDTDDAELVLPFVAPKRAMGEVFYHSPLPGLSIDGVKADGAAVNGEAITVFLDDIDMRTVAAAGDAHVYVVTTGQITAREDTWSLVAISELRDDGDFDLIEYAIPRSAGHVSIEYRVRQPATNDCSASCRLDMRLPES